MQIFLRQLQTHEERPTERGLMALNAKSQITSLVANQTEDRKDHRYRTAG